MTSRVALKNIHLDAKKHLKVSQTALGGWRTSQGLERVTGSEGGGRRETQDQMSERTTPCRKGSFLRKSLLKVVTQHQRIAHEKTMLVFSVGHLPPGRGLEESQKQTIVSILDISADTCKATAVLILRP